MRSGGSLVELMVAVALTGIVIGTAGASLLRQQRGARRVAVVAGAESQQRPLAHLLPAELALLDASAGDLVAGQVSDSVLQLRAVVAGSFTCDTAAHAVTLLPLDTTSTAGVPIGAVARSPAQGDSLWFWLSDSAGWQARRIVAAVRTQTGCAVPRASLGPAHRLTVDRPVDIGGAVPIRITRHERYVIYRASDRRWYLGLRDWSAVTNQFAPPQPVAGPFLRAAGGSRTGFRYFDAAGAELVPDGAVKARIARVRLTSLVPIGGIGAADTVYRDSADVALAGLHGP